MKRLLAAVGLCWLVTLAACATAPETDAGKAEVRARAAATLAQAKAADASLAKFLDRAEGYAVFPTVGKGGLIAGGGYGKGVLYEGGEFVGYCDLTQVTIGGQIGGQAYSEIIALETKGALLNFKDGDLELSAQVTAVAVESGTGKNARYADGVAVFTMNEKGLMAEAVVGGQQFTFEKK